MAITFCYGYNTLILLHLLISSPSPPVADAFVSHKSMKLEPRVRVRVRVRGTNKTRVQLSWVGGNGGKRMRKRSQLSFNWDPVPSDEPPFTAPWNYINSLSRGLAASLLVLFISFTSIGSPQPTSTPSHSNNTPLTVSSVAPAWAEDELSSKYRAKGFDASLVDQSCLVDHCSLQAKACLAQDADCRKGLVCTAKCLGDNSCITGCMARYGNERLDDFLKCTIEDHSCIQVAILPGGMDNLEQAPLAPAPTVVNFDLLTLQGPWYKVIGFNPNYDCYPCQRNTFTVPATDGGNFMNSKTRSPMLEVDVQFSMPRMLPDGTTTIPPGLKRESISFREEEENIDTSDGSSEDDKSPHYTEPLSIGLNDYQTHELMIFDTPDYSLQNNNIKDWLTLKKGTSQEKSYKRTAHSEGEMFGLKFWENWYVIGENDPGMQEFKFVYYNGKTRQNTYEGAFVYSRTKTLGPDALRKVYNIASEAGLNPRQFCKIQNGCFREESNASGLGSPSNPFRGILASYKVSQLLGVEPVAAEGVLKSTQTVSDKLRLKESTDMTPSSTRAWHHEIGDYLENPRRHFEAMDSLRVPMKWPGDMDIVEGPMDKTIK